MCAFAWKGNRYSNRKLKETLGWQCRVPMHGSLAALFRVSEKWLNSRKTNVAIVGCGMIADQHADQLRYLPDCELVAACDTDELMARQLAERFRIPGVFTDAAEMLRAGGVDAVHITTHAQPHFALGRLCLEAGCHVYIEKPFTVNAAEAEELLDLAQAAGRRITVGHNLQFSPEALRMRQFVRDGFLGGPPVHVECIQCYSHDDPTYGKSRPRRPAPLGPQAARLAPAQPDQPRRRQDRRVPRGRGAGAALRSASPARYLVDHGHADIVDEVRAVLRDERGTTAFFLFTTQFGAGSQELRLFGTAGNLVLDNTYRTVAPRAAVTAQELPALFPGPAGARPGAGAQHASSTYASSPGRSSRWTSA